MPRVPASNLTPVVREERNPAIEQEIIEAARAAITKGSQPIIHLSFSGGDVFTQISTPPLNLSGDNEDSSEENVDWDPLE